MKTSEFVFFFFRFLASGDSLSSISFAYWIGRSTACMIVREVCEVLWNVLQPIYLPTPSTDEWLEIGKRFGDRWNLPNCVGAIDGKHVVIRAPNNSGSQYFNYKKQFSIVLLAVCDADYKFTYVDVGSYGSQSDGGVLRLSSFGYKLDHNKLNLPVDAPLPNTAKPVPYFFVGDEAFPLKTNLMRPYSGRNLPEDKSIFNYRLSRARRCIENAFGILAIRWLIFTKVINAFPETVDKIILATVALHNFIMASDGRRYLKNLGNSATGPTALRPVQELRRLGARNAQINAVDYRNYLKDYVNNINPVPWQTEHVRRKN